LVAALGSNPQKKNKTKKKKKPLPKFSPSSVRAGGLGGGLDFPAQEGTGAVRISKYSNLHQPHSPFGIFTNTPKRGTKPIRI
jgi:hypothetical protein